VTLIYLSADGVVGNSLEDSEKPSSLPQDPAQAEWFAAGGISLNLNLTPQLRDSGNQTTPCHSECFYREDLIPYTRKHLFLIIDSDNSKAFSNIPNLFGKQVLCLMSPTGQPPEIKDASTAGSLFTFFLTDPVLAFAFVLGKDSLPKDVYESARLEFESFAIDFTEELTNNSLHPAFPLFMQDEFLQRFILNFVFCTGVCMYHKYFREDQNAYVPSSDPKLPQELFHHVSLQKAIYNIANKFGSSLISQVSGFSDPLLRPDESLE